MLLTAVEVNRQQLAHLTNLVNSVVAGNMRPAEQLPQDMELPLASVEQVDQLEERLRQEPTLVTAMVSVLQSSLS